MKIPVAFLAIVSRAMAMAFPQATAITPTTPLEATPAASPYATSPSVSISPPPPTCTTTHRTLGNPFVPGLLKGISKSYLSTVTSTHYVDCKGCVLKMDAFFLGHGPVVPSVTSIEIVQSSVSWDWACASGTGMAVMTGSGGDGEVMEASEVGTWDLGGDGE
ncbi:hypothetical protein E2P81_ATG11786 [Venturia nashicola]|uniref:Uncharacterized protein n=1 Tax=Venturia nashicola TaxID=86259 RepID=A0A4Z1NXV7_9PEZI|nr:hypothetical protein E6O75_ATG11477 [Venturia nashicola]TLD24450.1 hypothetical protein E2P81_ATG11786 [Venturia nashicola]